MKKNNRAAQIGLVNQVSAILKTHTQAGAFFLLALSGGVDSIVLLHALTSLKEKLPFKLHAMHVHHGLSAFADDWAHHCQQVCEALNVPLSIVKVQVDRASKSGLEAAARAARYEALFAYRDEHHMQPDFILTAHHEQDQAETLLLQLSRGAGVKGLAGMAIADRQRRILRPLLTTAKSDLFDYAQTHALNWCEDDSNDNTTFERNFLRHEILPVWSARHPALHQNLARSAVHLAEASHLLEVLAQIDAEPLIKNNSLCLVGLKKLPLARAKNVLRWWFSCFAVQMPNADYLQEMISQLFSAKNDASIDFMLSNHHALKRYQQRAYLYYVTLQKSEPFVWQGEDQVALPHGNLYFKRAKGAGLLRIHPQVRLTVRYRRGGERIKTTENRPTRTLKYLMQEHQVPPWARATWPLIDVSGQLACVPNVGVDVALQTQVDEDGVFIFYQSDVPSRLKKET